MNEQSQREQRAEIERLRIALAVFADRGNWYFDGKATITWEPQTELSLTPWLIAQRALDATNSPDR